MSLQPMYSIAYYATKEFAHVITYCGDTVVHGKTYTNTGIVNQCDVMKRGQVYTREYSDKLPDLAALVINKCAKLGFPRHCLTICTTV